MSPGITISCTNPDSMNVFSVRYKVIRSKFLSDFSIWSVLIAFLCLANISSTLNLNGVILKFFDCNKFSITKCNIIAKRSIFATMLQKYTKITGLTILVLISFISATGFSQTLNGRVFSKETNTPIPYASIYLTELSTGTIADSAGFFSISNFPSSPTTLKISAIGFGTFTTTITYF